MEIVSKYKQFKRWMKFYSPTGATLEDWRTFYERFASEAPVRYFITRTIPRIYRHVVTYPIRRFLDKTYYPMRCWFNGSNQLDTGLPLCYQEYDQKLLHAAFNSFVKFIDVEMSHLAGNEGGAESPGIAHLRWVIDNEDYEEHKVTAREMIALYYWWKNRKLKWDSLDMSYDQALAKAKDLSKPYDMWAPMTDATREVHNIHEEKRNELYQEDTDMLIRLVKIREHVWS